LLSNKIETSTVIYILLGGVVGAFLGKALFKKISSKILSLIFAIILILSGAVILIK
jgi:uncharacterized membrane protein YfcA